MIIEAEDRKIGVITFVNSHFIQPIHHFVDSLFPGWIARVLVPGNHRPQHSTLSVDHRPRFGDVHPRLLFYVLLHPIQTVSTQHRSHLVEHPSFASEVFSAAGHKPLEADGFERFRLASAQRSHVRIEMFHVPAEKHLVIPIIPQQAEKII